MIKNLILIEGFSDYYYEWNTIVSEREKPFKWIAFDLSIFDWYKLSINDLFLSSSSSGESLIERV